MTATKTPARKASTARAAKPAAPAEKKAAPAPSYREQDHIRPTIDALKDANRALSYWTYRSPDTKAHTTQKPFADIVPTGQDAAPAIRAAIQAVRARLDELEVALDQPVEG